MVSLEALEPTGIGKRLKDIWTADGRKLSEVGRDPWTGGEPESGVYCLSTLNDMIEGSAFPDGVVAQLYYVGGDGGYHHVAFISKIDIKLPVVATRSNSTSFPFGKSCIPVRITTVDDPGQLEVWVVDSHRLPVVRDDVAAGTVYGSDHRGLFYVLRVAGD